jgi:uncharacterized membrane protein (DUF485 family)
MGFHERGRLVPSSVYGCRRWNVNDGKLWSFSAGYRWEPGWQTATCHGAPHHLSNPNGAYGVYCGCGFWAYWNKNGEHVKITMPNPNQVVGIIEGRGSALVGNSGFRVSEARIVALVVDSSRKQLLVKAGFLAGIICYFAVMAVIAFTTDQANWSVLYGVVGGILFGVGVVALRRVPIGAYQKLARNYPDVKFYNSWSAAFKDFPVEVPSWKKKK